MSDAISKIISSVKEYNSKHNSTDAIRVEKPPRILNVKRRLEKRGWDWVPESIKNVCPYLKNGECCSPKVGTPSSAFVVPFRCMTVLHKTCNMYKAE